MGCLSVAMCHRPMSAALQKIAAAEVIAGRKLPTAPW